MSCARVSKSPESYVSRSNPNISYTTASWSSSTDITYWAKTGSVNEGLWGLHASNCSKDNMHMSFTKLNWDGNRSCRAVRRIYMLSVIFYEMDENEQIRTLPKLNALVMFLLKPSHLNCPAKWLKLDNLLSWSDQIGDSVSRTGQEMFCSLHIFHLLLWSASFCLTCSGCSVIWSSAEVLVLKKKSLIAHNRGARLLLYCSFHANVSKMHKSRLTVEAK